MFHSRIAAGCIAVLSILAAASCSSSVTIPFEDAAPAAEEAVEPAAPEPTATVVNAPAPTPTPTPAPTLEPVVAEPVETTLVATPGYEGLIPAAQGYATFTLTIARDRALNGNIRGGDVLALVVVGEDDTVVLPEVLVYENLSISADPPIGSPELQLALGFKDDEGATAQSLLARGEGVLASDSYDGNMDHTLNILVGGERFIAEPFGALDNVLIGVGADRTPIGGPFPVLSVETSDHEQTGDGDYSAWIAVRPEDLTKVARASLDPDIWLVPA